MRISFILIFFPLCFFSNLSYCQSGLASLFTERSVQAGFGTTHLIGDLGGGIGIGKDNPKDLDIGSSRVGMSMSFVYNSRRKTHIIPSLSFILLSSNDLKTQNIDRRIRNFKSTTILFEPALRVEQCLTDLHRRYIRTGGYFFMSAGVGFPIYHAEVSYADANNGSDLKLPHHNPIRTSIVLPLSVSYRYYYHNSASIGFELMGRKSFTDVLDGVGEKAYQDPDLGPSQQLPINFAKPYGESKDFYITLMINFRFRTQRT